MPTTPLIKETHNTYQLTVIINNPSILNGLISENGIEKIELWTNTQPQDINIPAYILQHGFKYKYNDQSYRFISPYHIISIFYDPNPTIGHEGYQLFQI